MLETGRYPVVLTLNNAAKFYINIIQYTIEKKSQEYIWEVNK